MDIKIKRYIELILEESKKISITSYRTFEEIRIKLIEPSLKIRDLLSSEKNIKSAADIGSGAGIPGIPLAVTLPEISFSLIESNLKKFNFLEKIKSELNLENVQIIMERSEILAREEEYREKYSIVLARALGGLGTSLELLAPFAEPGGKLIIFRGLSEKGEPDYEKIRNELGTEFEEKLENIYEGIVWIFRKTGKTIEKYPRKPGIPAKREEFILKRRKDDRRT